MKHLDELSVAAILEGSSTVSPELRAHLQEPCEECERLLERLPALDAEVDAALLHLAPRREPSLDEVGFQRVWRAAKSPRDSKGWVLAFAAAAAVLAVGAFAALRPSAAPDRGIKGSARIAVELSAAVQDASGVVRRVEPGERLPASGVLLLRYHATEEGRAMLLEHFSAGSLEPLGTFALVPGTHDLRSGQDLAGVPLSPETRDLTLYLVAAPFAEALTLDGARAAVESPAASRTLSVTEVHFELETTP